MATRQRIHELIRFGLVGGFNAATYFGGYTALHLLGVPYLLGALIAFVVSASIGYWLHEHWTFKGATPTLRGWVSWLAAQGGATLLNLLLLALLVDGVGWGPIVAQAVLMPVMPVATYLIGRRWVFSRAA
ncbi:MAG TPA: GtrA family protein [Baekduia sp.]|uniref:GtrA family protein n=1 Tax=Baekduia sp. TaxID=2600305 RepID=UPI002D766575|nr:GtrA family protein [Baekduia sp.]HET6507778.1 GtrA family protein [Baekduia sp.]